MSYTGRFMFTMIKRSTFFLFSLGFASLFWGCGGGNSDKKEEVAQERSLTISRGGADWAAYQLGWESEWKVITDPIELSIKDGDEIGLVYYCDSLNAYFMQADFSKKPGKGDFEQELCRDRSATTYKGVLENIPTSILNLSSNQYRQVIYGLNAERAFFLNNGPQRLLALETESDESRNAHKLYWTEALDISCEGDEPCPFDYTAIEKQEIALDSHILVDPGQETREFYATQGYFANFADQDFSLNEVARAHDFIFGAVHNKELDSFYVTDPWRNVDSNPLEVSTTTQVPEALTLTYDFAFSADEQLTKTENQIFTRRSGTINGVSRRADAAISVTFPSFSGEEQFQPVVDFESMTIDLKQAGEDMLENPIQYRINVYGQPHSVYISFPRAWLDKRNNRSVDLSFLQELEGWDPEWLYLEKVIGVIVDIDLSNAQGAYGREEGILLQPGLSWSDFTIDWYREAQD